MKKIFKVARVMLAVILISFAVTANAADCSKIVDLTCQAFSNMNKQVDACNSLEELSALDFGSAMNGLDDVNDLPDSCIQYHLTKADKTKLKNSIRDLANNVVNKIYDLSGGILSKDYIQSMMDGEFSKIYDAIDKADTYDDFVGALS